MNVSIIGAGLVGPVAACLFAQRGDRVSLFEARPDMRRVEPPRGRSITVVVSARGWNALEKIGAAEAVRAISIPLRGRTIHSLDSIRVQPYGACGERIYAVSRNLLNQQLLEHVDKHPNIEISFEHRFAGLSGDGDNLKLIFEGIPTPYPAGELVAGADGARSEVRNKLYQRVGGSVQAEPSGHAYVELNLTAEQVGRRDVFDPTTMHVWPRGNVMLVAFPNTDRGFNCSLFLPLEGGVESFAVINRREAFRSLFKREFPDVLQFVPAFEQQYARNRPQRLMTIQCSPWHWKDRVVLIGDAAHAVLPFYGQGMNAGFEDSSVLMDCLESHGGEVAGALALYDRLRKPNGDALAQLSKENFVELRDLVGKHEFLNVKRIETLLSLRYPEKIMPMYTRVAFTLLPYETALQIGKTQNELLKRFASIPDFEERLNAGAFDREVEEFHRTIGT